jgi:hypothetical protein
MTECLPTARLLKIIPSNSDNAIDSTETRIDHQAKRK